MQINKTNKLGSAALILGFYGVLCLNDFNLYPHLGSLSIAVLSFLRLLLLLIPLVAGFMVIRFKDYKFLKHFLVTIWLLFIPYTIYSVVEVRHVSELCRLPELGLYYTDACATDLWKLFPSFLYALVGSLSFVFSLHQVAFELLKNKAHRATAITFVSTLCGFASTFGIYSRLNIWNIFINPALVLQSIIEVVREPFFALNTLAYSVFTLLFFVGVVFVLRFFKNSR